MSRLFVSQELLDQWASEGKIELVGNELRLLAEARAFDIQPGVRFVKVAAGEDRQKLTGKVKTEPQMALLNAELYMNSVLIGEDAYDVQTGFLCEVPETLAVAQTTGPVTASAPAKSADERAMLAQFLLENLSG